MALEYRPEVFAEERIRKLLSKQGDWAVIEARQSSQVLNNKPRIKVVTVLWPNVLQIIGTNSGFQTKADSQLYIYDNAADWSDSLKGQFSTLEWKWLSSIKDPWPAVTTSDFVVFSGPYPTTGITTFLNDHSKFQLLSLPSSLLKKTKAELKGSLVHTIPAKTYPRMTQSLEVPAVYHVLVTRGDTPNADVEQLLTQIFINNGLMAHPLFRLLDAKTNAEFKDFYSYHPAARTFLKL
ncbi:MAG: hypothetical protein HQM12_12970 [SAR324 cluster bacterium]|nr:hypothetical protein [SAR324 cluster bacterium]